MNSSVTTQVFEKPPADFRPRVEIAACYLEVDHHLLLLQRMREKSEPGLWGVPAGKMEPGETPLHGGIRELFEETGIAVTHLIDLGKLYMRKPGLDYVYHCFKVPMDRRPEVHLSDEHLQYRWVTWQEIKTLPLMTGALEALKYYGWSV